ncbi:MAG: ATP-grasp domain-containing protein [Desulfobacterales bacterium]|nr:ATP-grasp domain-containing protein [Desulfobacterales bacterium]
MDCIKVLILEGMNRQGLSVARALKMAGGYSVHVATGKNSLYGQFKKLLNLKIVDAYHRVDVASPDSIWVPKLIYIIEKMKIDAVLPTGQAVMAVSRAKSILSNYCKVLVEDYEKMIRFHDKSQTMAIARALMIPHPRTFLPETPDEAKSYAQKTGYPVVVKSRQGEGAHGVWYARDPMELAAIYKKYFSILNSANAALTGDSWPMLQEYIPGEVHDVPVFCIQGRMRLGLTQKRLIMNPSSGGPGIVNITTKNHELLDYARKISECVKWNGVMQVEFKIDDRDDQPRLMEVNPRFWGTTWLTVSAGLNYPHYLVSRAFGLPVNFPENYPVGLYGRWPMMELAAIFEKPTSYDRMLQRTGDFLRRFQLKNCVYYLG